MAMADLFELLFSSGGKPSQKMATALVLKYLAEMMLEEEDGEDGTLAPATEPFREKSVRVRPDFIPVGG